jgi:hypothetical protein
MGVEMFPAAPDRPGGGGPVATLTYRSRAATSLDLSAMRGLLTHAKARNRALGVTGLLLFAEDSYFQWLEGPRESLDTVWTAVRDDPRHDGVELIGRHRASRRMFGGWDMRFVSRGGALSALTDRDDTRRAPGTLVDAFAELAIRGDQAALGEALEDLVRYGWDIEALGESILTPAARRLGDWWRADLCDGAEIALGLSLIRAELRRIGPAQGGLAALDAPPRLVLVATLPGEPHVLGAALAGDAFRRAGCRVQAQFPPSDTALAACLDEAWFDVLVLCLSDVFGRLERLGAMAATVARAREASRNPAIRILVGGRAFHGRPDLAAIVGADAVWTGAAETL